MHPQSNLSAAGTMLAELGRPGSCFPMSGPTIGKAVSTAHDDRRDTTLPTKVRLVKAMVFPVVTYECMTVGPSRRLNAEELMLLNCGVREDC